MYTQISASYLDLHLDIDNRGRLKIIINFPFISSNIPALPAYGVYISQLIPYSCTQYSDFLDRAQLLTQNLLKKGNVAQRLKSLLQKLYGYHRDLVDHYKISISQTTNDLLRRFFSLPYD